MIKRGSDGEKWREEQREGEAVIDRYITKVKRGEREKERGRERERERKG